MMFTLARACIFINLNFVSNLSDDIIEHVNCKKNCMNLVSFPRNCLN